MNKFRKLAIFTILLTFVLALALPGTAYAASDSASQPHDQLVFGDTYTLHSGDTLVGDLIILGGTVTLEKDSTVTGNVVLIGGTVSIAGTVDKDLVTFGGTPTLESSAHIHGNAVTFGSHLNTNAGKIDGQVITNSGSVFSIHVLDGVPTMGVSRLPVLWGFLGLSFSVFFMTALAIGLVLLMPKQTALTARVLVQQPVAAGGMGCLTMVVAPIILVALAITIIFSPISVLGLIVLAALALFGWVAIGLEVGNRLATAMHQDWHPAVSAGVGTFGLTLVALGLSRVIMCVGWVVPFTVSMLALGAVVLVFFGAGKTSVLVPAAVSSNPFAPVSSAPAPASVQPITPVVPVTPATPVALDTPVAPVPPQEAEPPVEPKVNPDDEPLPPAI